MTSMGIDTGVETSSEVLHNTHGHNLRYVMDFFPNRSFPLNHIRRTMLVYFSIQIAPKEEIARRKIG